MNSQLFRVIFSRVFNRPVVTSELPSGRGKAARAESTVITPVKALATKPHRMAVSVMLALGALTTGQAYAVLPTGQDVVHGTASITTAGNTMNISQGAGNAIINWASFSIGSGNAVTFEHAAATDITLNRVTGLAKSQIDGALNANGRVFLMNPNGVVFGPSASVNVGSLAVSTHDINDANFKAGNYQFTAANTPTVGEIINHGTIVANGEQGFVLLATAGDLTNEKNASLKAVHGSVQMVSGNAFKLTLPSGSNPFLNIELTGDALSAREPLFSNAGLIKAAHVELKASEAWVAHSGVIEATSLEHLTHAQNGSVLMAGPTVVLVGGSTTAQGNIELQGHGNGMGVSLSDAALKSDNNIVIAGTGNLSGVEIGTSSLTGKNIRVDGQSHNSGGVLVSDNARLTATDILAINGQSHASAGAVIKGTLSAGDVVIAGISTEDTGLHVNASFSAHNLTLKGTSKAKEGVEISTFGQSASISGKTSIEGHSQSGSGVSIWDLNFTTPSSPTLLTGSSVSGDGVHFIDNFHPAGQTLANITLTGSSQNGNGIFSNEPLYLTSGSTFTGTSVAGHGIHAEKKLTVGDSASIRGYSSTGTAVAGKVTIAPGGSVFENTSPLPTVDIVKPDVIAPIEPVKPVIVVQPVEPLTPVMVVQPVAPAKPSGVVQPADPLRPAVVAAPPATPTLSTAPTTAAPLIKPEVVTDIVPINAQPLEAARKTAANLRQLQPAMEKKHQDVSVSVENHAQEEDGIEVLL